MVTTETVYVVLNIHFGLYLAEDYTYTDQIDRSLVFKTKQMADDAVEEGDEIVLNVQRTWAVNIVGGNNGS